MKMKVSTRIIFTVYLLVVILLCAFLILSMYGLFASDNLILAVKTMLEGGIEYVALYTVIFAVMIVVGFMLMFFGIRSGRPKTALLNSFENGKILISVTAIEQLAKKYIKEFNCIRDEKTSVLLKNNAAELHVKIQVMSDADIPAVTNDLRKGLIEYVSSHSGISISDARIIVTSISDSITVQNQNGGIK